MSPHPPAKHFLDGIVPDRQGGSTSASSSPSSTSCTSPSRARPSPSSFATPTTAPPASGSRSARRAPRPLLGLPHAVRLNYADAASRRRRRRERVDRGSGGGALMMFLRADSCTDRASGSATTRGPRAAAGWHKSVSAPGHEGVKQLGAGLVSYGGRSVPRSGRGPVPRRRR